MKFKYKSYGAGVVRPVIPIEIVHKDRVVPYEVLVDSGADSCIFDAQLADILDIDVAQGERREVMGITGSSGPYYVHPVTIKVGGWTHRIQAGFLPNIAPLG